MHLSRKQVFLTSPLGSWKDSTDHDGNSDPSGSLSRSQLQECLRCDNKQMGHTAICLEFFFLGGGELNVYERLLCTNFPYRIVSFKGFKFPQAWFSSSALSIVVY